MATDYPYIDTNHYHYVEFRDTSGSEEKNYNSYMDWGLYLEAPAEVSPPEPNTYMIEVPGRNGSLDLTESAMGGVTYQDRKMNFKFICRKHRNEWNRIYHELINAVHGKPCRIICSDDDRFYYEGRVTVEKWGNDNKMAFPTVSATVRPFKTALKTKKYTETLKTGEESRTPLKGKSVHAYQEERLVFFQTGPFTIDWNNFTKIVVKYQKNATMTSIYITDGTNDWTETENEVTDVYSRTITRAELEADGVDWEKIERVVIMGDVVSKSLTVHGIATVNAVIVTGASGKAAAPVVTATIPVTMTVNGKTYSVPADGWESETAMIQGDSTRMLFAATGTIGENDTVTVQYQEGWL